MDTYSLHEFMIRSGHLIDYTPEFESFQRAYADSWPAICSLIDRLEDICVECSVPLAIVDGKVNRQNPRLGVATCKDKNEKKCDFQG